MQSKILIIAGLFALLLSTQTNAQTSDEEPIILERYSCEDGSARADSVQHYAKEKDERIFVISRAGVGESELENDKRLAHVRKTLLEIHGWSRLQSEVVFARGERVKGKGKVEFYVGGRLYLVFLVALKGKSVCLHCCEDPTEQLQKTKFKQRPKQRKSIKRR